MSARYLLGLIAQDVPQIPTLHIWCQVFRVEADVVDSNAVGVIPHPDDDRVGSVKDTLNVPFGCVSVKSSSAHMMIPDEPDMPRFHSVFDLKCVS